MKLNNISYFGHVRAVRKFLTRTRSGPQQPLISFCACQRVPMPVGFNYVRRRQWRTVQDGTRRTVFARFRAFKINWKWSGLRRFQSTEVARSVADLGKWNRAEHRKWLNLNARVVYCRDRIMDNVLNHRKDPGITINAMRCIWRAEFFWIARRRVWGCFTLLWFQYQPIIDIIRQWFLSGRLRCVLIRR